MSKDEIPVKVGLESSTGWLHSAVNLHVDVARQPDGTYKATCLGREATADSDSKALEQLQALLTDEVMQGKL